MECAQCHAENRAGRRFCAACGRPLAQTCRACGFSNEPEAKFCGGCGTPLAVATPPGTARLPEHYTPAHLAERIRSTRTALEGERKQVTVLFADLKGSMELLADRDPEDARVLLDPVLERMMDAVHQYDGTVNQVMGDGIMALFGAPLALEDHAVRAGYAALKMQQAMGAHGNPRAGVDIQIRIGLNSGEVVVRGIGNDLTMDYSAIGQTTHLAARMEQLASPGTILVTEDFARQTEDRLHFKPLGQTVIKGLAQAVDVFELVDAEPTRARFQAASGRGLTRFVGRAAEVALFHRALERAQNGQGEAVAVIGEPGVGKSRLFYEFLDSRHVDGWLVLETGCLSYGAVTPFLPLRDLLRGYCGIEERDDPGRIEDKLTGRVLALDPALDGILPALRSLLDLSERDARWQALDPSRRRQLILESAKRLFVRQSQVRPLLLAFENLHWIDAQTQAFLDSLMDSLPTSRILLLVNYRPEYRHGWANRTYYAQVRLDPLARDHAGELLRVLLGESPDLAPLKELLIARTEGNPLFLEESVRMLVEQKVLTGERGNRRLVKPVSHIQVPATVQAILAARIDRLLPAHKRLLQCASVIGKDLSLPLLRAVAGEPEAELQLALADLQAGEFLYETALFPEIEYTFKHVLTQAVAYGSLLQDRRRALHARIAEAIEALHADRLGAEVERLAHHTLQGGVWEKAVAYYRQAGTKAAMRSAYREAVECFEHALFALRQLPETSEHLALAFDLRLELRPWLAPLAEYRRMLGNLVEAEALARRLGDPRREGLVCAYMTDYHRLTGASEQAVACGERALERASALGDFSLQVLANMLLGHACHATGDYRRAVTLLRKNVETLSGPLVRERFGSAGLPSVLSRSFAVFSLNDLGNFGEAIALAEEAVRIADQLDTTHSQILAAHSLGLAYLCKGDLDRALPILQGAYTRSEAGRIPLGARLLASALGYAHALSGRIAEGIPLLGEAMRRAEQLQVFFRYALWLAWLGEAHLLAGRPDEARALADRALAHALAHKEMGHQAYAFRLLGEIDAHERPGPEAEAAYQNALGLAEPLGMEPLRGQCLLGLGVLHQRLGHAEPARKQLAAAAAVFRSMDMTYWATRAEAALTGS